jgi:hypothetical protein
MVVVIELGSEEIEMELAEMVMDVGGDGSARFCDCCHG